MFYGCVSLAETMWLDHAAMSIEAARAFNRTCSPGSLVAVAARDGTTRTGKLRAPAFV